MTKFDIHYVTQACQTQVEVEMLSHMKRILIFFFMDPPILRTTKKQTKFVTRIQFIIYYKFILQIIL